MNATDSEYLALTAGAGLVDCGDRTQLELSGEDRTKFLNNLTTNSVGALKPGQGCETFVLDVRGHVVGHLLVFCTPDTLVLDTEPGQAERLMKHLERYHIRERIELHDRTGQWGELLLAGAGVDALLQRIVADSLSIPHDYLGHTALRIAGQPVWLRRVEIAEPNSFFMSSPRDALPAVAGALAAVGAARCSAVALETVRIEAGWPRYGVDITDQNLPQEVGRNQQAISFTKGCYLGQETVARIDALGHVNKQLVSVRFSGPEVPTPGIELHCGGKVIGTVTSSTFSPRHSAPVALAYVRREHLGPGTLVESAYGVAEVKSSRSA